MDYRFIVAFLVLVSLHGAAGRMLAAGSSKNSHAWEKFAQLAGYQPGLRAPGIAALKRYFHHFGYIDKDSGEFSEEFDATLEAAIRTYQQNFKLKPTGVLDNSTVQQLMRPRCGVRDIVNGTNLMNPSHHQHVAGVGHSVAHYSFFPNSPKWPDSTRKLTYFIDTSDQQYGATELSTVLSAAFAKWEAVSPFQFEETTDDSSSHLHIAFYSGDHDDEHPFDGPEHTLAHSFAPTNGSLHFDASEKWVIDISDLQTPGAFDLESVAVHEIGHLLGLDHSDDQSAIMYPTIDDGTRKVDLNSDDIQGIQSLYGSN